MAKVRYSLRARGLFTVGLLLCAVGLPGQELKKSPVVKVRDPLATRFFQPNSERVRAMVQLGLQKVAGEKTTAAAWRAYVTPKDFIGLKVNAHSGALSGTRPAVVAAVIESLLQSGIPASRITIWDQHRRDLKRAGYEKLSKKYHVQLAGARDHGFDDWHPYRQRSFQGRLQEGDHLFGKVKYSADSHLSKLITEKFTAIICIHSPLFISQKGASGHLKELAMASVDNTRRFEHPVYYANFRDAIVGICDRVAFSHTLDSKKIRAYLVRAKTNPSGAAQALALFPLGSDPASFYFEPHSEKALPAVTVFRLAHERAMKTKEPQMVRILTKALAWNQLMLPDGRTVLDHNAWQDKMTTHTKLRFHITDALVCQYHQGQESRPDYAAAINELWFSPDLVALDVLSHQLVAKLRRSANLPKGVDPEVLHRSASRSLLGNIYPEDMALESITMPAAGPRENRE